MKKGEIILIFVYMAWGLSYLFMKVGLNDISPSVLIMLRFGLAFIVTSLLFLKKIRNVNRKVVLHSMVLGGILFLLFLALMHGMEYVKASSAGFLASLTVIFVPVIDAVIKHIFPSIRVILSSVLALAGIFVINAEKGISFGAGEVLCMMAALLYAVHILLTNYFAQADDSLQLGILQLGFAGAFGAVFMLIGGQWKLPSTAQSWGAVLGLALICSAFGFVAQTVAQKDTSPERTGILFALEPVFSAVFCFLFLHEVLSWQGYVGAALILTGVLLSSGGKTQT